MVPQLQLRDGFCQTVLLLQLGLKAILKFHDFERIADYDMPQGSNNL